MLTARNPTTGDIISQYPCFNLAELNHSVQLARQAYTEWSRDTFNNRAEKLLEVAVKLRDKKHYLAELMALEMGKPLHEGVAEVEKSAWCAEYYAKNASHFLSKDTLQSDASTSYVDYAPLGVVLGILPWNAPVWLAFRFLAPALMAGNTCIMKHDPHVPMCAQTIEGLFRSVTDVPVVTSLPIDNKFIADAIQHESICAVSFTGSSQAGRIVASQAAQCLKPAVLELGGSDPLVILADANLEKAVDTAVLSRMINAGQSCIAAKRIIVEEPVYADVVGLLHSKLEKLVVGDPQEKGTDIGPLARKDLQLNLHRQIETSVQQGARCLLGGHLPDSAGYFYPVTLLVDATRDMCVMQEETFGPVMVVSKVKDADEALKLANATEYGLGAAVWTENTTAAGQFIDGLEAGQVAVNGIVKTDPRLPSGGVKNSGYGRELGPHGIKEFVNAKQVWIG